MYKQSTTYEKLKSKLRKHFGKLLKDTVRIENSKKTKNFVPILLVNILNSNFIGQIEAELKEINKSDTSQRVRIMNVEMLNELV